MKLRLAFSITALLVVSLCSISCGGGAASSDELGVIETNYGRIVIEFLPQYAPRHVEHFRALAGQGFFNGTKIHRLVRDKNRPIAIQGGDPNTISGEPSTWGQGQPGQQTVPAEFSRSIKHERGIVSAARKPNDPDSATSQFFICAAAMPSWDGQYSIFGKVVEGMNVVDTIGRAPLWPNTERPMDPVVVTRFYLAKKGEY
jgi:peptidyl-prolyl cis-trans isomerase B (cyclophilin B)